MNELFRKFAQIVAEAAGSAGAFIAAAGFVVIWAVSGPLFKFSETWQLVINTSTTIITFLMIFLVQNAQNRDSKATQLKLDELIKSQAKAKDKLIDVEDDPDKLIESEKKKEKKRKVKSKKHTK